jgi:hypothetical protein
MAIRNVSGRWQAQQSTGHVLTFDLQQTGTTLTGTASVTPGIPGGSAGTGEGAVSETGFVFTVNWPGSGKAEYSGSFGPNGRLSGVTFDLDHPSVNATWFSIRTFS